MLTVMASSERPSIWDRTQSIRSRFLPQFLRLPKVAPAPKIADNAPALKQLEDLQKESSIVAHANIAALSKPTTKHTKDRIFAFVESSKNPVSVAEMAIAIPGVSRSGLSSRVSEMFQAGSLKRVYIKGATGWQMHYTVPEGL